MNRQSESFSDQLDEFRNRQSRILALGLGHERDYLVGDFVRMLGASSLRNKAGKAILAQRRQCMIVGYA